MHVHSIHFLSLSLLYYLIQHNNSILNTHTHRLHLIKKLKTSFFFFNKNNNNRLNNELIYLYIIYIQGFKQDYDDLLWQS